MVSSVVRVEEKRDCIVVLTVLKGIYSIYCIKLLCNPYAPPNICTREKVDIALAH